MSGFWQAPRTSSYRRLLSGVMVGLGFASLAVLGFTSAGSLAANGYGGYGYGCPGYGYGYCPPTTTPPPPQPATLVLTPETETNTVDDQHCVLATVRDQFGDPMPGITVRFSVTGSVTTSGQATTNAAGQATFCYTGPALPGADLITAYADTDNDNVNDATEPEDTATKAWVIPANMVGCKVTYGGRITAANGDKATFGGNAKGDGPKGNENYQDHGPATRMHVKSIDVLSVVCNTAGTQASIFGTASIDGAGSFDFRIDLKDLGEPGSSDTYRIRLSNGYDSGEKILAGGNVQIH